MRTILFGLAAAGLTFASAASAQPAASAAAPGATPHAASAVTAAAADKPVCRSSIPTGTRFPVKECHTQAQWDQIAADARQLTQDSQRNYTPR